MKWSNARTAIVSCGVAAVTAFGVAAAPALAGNRPSATPSPVILSGTRSLAIINGNTTIARLGLPAGSWVVFAKADASTAGGGPVQLHCTLKAGSSSDHTDPELESGGTGAFDENIALNVAHKFAKAGAALLSCNSSGVTVDVISIKMTAIKAGKLSIVSLQLV